VVGFFTAAPLVGFFVADWVGDLLLPDDFFFCASSAASE
jgi:hypothetical protein